MAHSAKTVRVVLEPGQLWKTDQGYVEIVQLGKTLAHYRRTLKPRQRGAALLLAPMKAVVEMISRTEGHLMPESLAGSLRSTTAS